MTEAAEPLPLRIRRALAERLHAAARQIDVGVEARSDPAEDAARVALAMCDAISRDPDPALTWLLIVAITGRYPDAETVEWTHRRLDVDPPADVVAELLAEGASLAVPALLEFDTVTPLADVHHSAVTAHHTGIQRVARRLIEANVRKVRPVVWRSDSSGYRPLTEDESERLGVAGGSGKVHPETVLVPWRAPLLLTEVPAPIHARALEAVARFGVAPVSVIGYDTIPISSRQFVNAREAVKFARFLSVVKWSESVVAISAAAAGEFRGFVSMLPAQGLVGPRVVEVPLPADGVREVAVAVRERPLVVVVGSKEPRKNHVAVLFAAEVLWREGLDFELFFIGTYGWDTRLFRSWLKRLQRAGRRVSAPARVGDSALWEAYAGARFTVFPSLHEGYGLPVAESLAYGTPVITSSYGSTAEIAAAGGCVLVDPRDDDQLVAAMRRLLTDDAELERLRGEARGRPVWTWEQYAAQVWDVVGVSA